MNVLRITTNDFPDYPLIVEQGKDYVHTLETILTDHAIFDRHMGVGSSLTIKIEVIEMSQEEFAALEPWEP